MRLLILLTVFVGGCGTTSGPSTANEVHESLKDVYILSILIRDHLINTNAQDIHLDELVQNDTLRRISANFEKIETIARGGYIAVQYQFSDFRTTKMELTDKEREHVNKLRIIERELSGTHDGEIQFEYGERFYHIRKIIVRKN